MAWPVGLGSKGNEGVSGQVTQLPGSIGYVELAYAKQNGVKYALIRNAAGKFLAPSIEGATAAAAGVAQALPATTDFRISIVNGAGDAAYPISSFTWILIYKNQRDAVKGAKLLAFLRWALHEGQQQVPALDYAPLPANIVAMLDQRLKTVSMAAR